MTRFAAALILSVFAATAARADQPAAVTAPQPTYAVKCQPREPLVQMMIRQHASPIIVKRTDDDELFEMWSDGEHWMALVTKPNGLTCPIAEGEGTVKVEEPRCIDPLKCPRV